jgi:hypothetical protein
LQQSLLVSTTFFKRTLITGCLSAVWTSHHQAEPLIYSFERFVVLSIFFFGVFNRSFPFFQTTGLVVTAAGQLSHKQHAFITPFLRFRSFGSARARRTITSSQTRSRKTLL